MARKSVADGQDESLQGAPDGGTTGRRYSPEERRLQVIEAATECFCAQGFHRASMATIAKEAKMSPGHIYNYFESKEEIIAAIIANDLKSFYEMTDSFTSAEDLISGLTHHIEHHMDAKLDGCRPVLMLETTAEASRHPQVAEAVQAFDSQIRERFIQLLAGDSVLDEEERAALEARVELICVLFEGIMVRGIRNPHLNRERLTMQVSLVIRRLFAESHHTTP